MTDRPLVERLEGWGAEHFGTQYPVTPILHEAADRIEQLEAELAELRAQRDVEYDCGWHDGVDHGARHAEAELLATLRQARDDLDSHGAGPSYAYIDEILTRYGFGRD